MMIKNNLSITFLLLSLLVLTGSKFDNSIKYEPLEKGVHVFSIDLSHNRFSVVPFASNSLSYVSDVAEKNNAIIAINAGFFDPNNQKTISYLIKNKKTVLNPLENENLTNNKKLKPYLKKILNRAEFRVLKCGDLTKVDIQNHNDKVINGCELIHSIQAGPMLLPEMKLEDEYFLVKEGGKVKKSSAGILKKYTRSAIGIKNNTIILVVCDNNNKKDIFELQRIFKKLNVDKAMCFDGGSSTSLFFNDKKLNKKLIINSTQESSQRRVKSILLIK